MITQSFHQPQGGVALDFQPQDLVAPFDDCEIRADKIVRDYEQTWFNLYLSDGNFWQFVHCIPTRTGKFKKGEVICTPYRGEYRSAINRNQWGKPYPSHIHAAANINGKWVNILSTIEPTFELTTSEQFTPSERLEWGNWEKYQAKSPMSKKQAIRQISETNLITNQERKQAIINAISGDDWSYAVWDLLNQAKDYQEEVQRKNHLLEKYQEEIKKQTLKPFDFDKIIEEKNQEIADLKKQLQEQTKIVSLDELRNLLNEKEPEQLFNWEKVKIGLTKYAWLQTAMAVIFTSLVTYFVSFIPELEPHKSEILTGLLTLFGISSIGQNSKQVIKNLK